jgi:hypothetical protein
MTGAGGRQAPGWDCETGVKLRDNLDRGVFSGTMIVAGGLSQGGAALTSDGTARSGSGEPRSGSGEPRSGSGEPPGGGAGCAPARAGRGGPVRRGAECSETTRVRR